MKCDAASMRRSAVCAELACSGDVAGVRRDAGQGVEGEDLDVGRSSRRASSRIVVRSLLGVGVRVVDVAWRPAGIRRARPARRRLRRGATRRPPRVPSALARPVRARAARARGARGRARRGARRRWLRPSRPRARGWRRRRRSRRLGTALARGWRAGTPRSVGTRGRRDVSAARAHVVDGVVEAVLDASELAADGFVADVEPRVVDVLQPVLDASDGVDAARARRRRRSRLGRRRASWRPGPRAGRARRRARRCDRSAPARGGTRRDATRRRRGSRRSVLAGRRRRSCRPASVASAMWSRASSRRSVDASIHAASRRALARSRAGAASPAASSAARIRCAPRLSPRTTQAQPNPLTMASASSGSCSMLHVNAASMLARSVRAKARCSAWSTAAHTLGGGCGRVGEPRGVGGEGTLGQSGVGHRFERERADAVEQPVADGRRRRRRRRRSPASGSRAGRRRRSPRPPARRAPRGRTRPPAGVRRRRRWPGPTGPAGRRGRAARSSIRSST